MACRADRVKQLAEFIEGLLDAADSAEVIDPEFMCDRCPATHGDCTIGCSRRIERWLSAGTDR